MKLFSIALLALFVALPGTLHAAGLQDAFGGGSPLATVQQASGAPTSDLGTLTGTIISAALSLVGILFLLLMVYSGYLWMTARGDEQQVEKAQKIIRGTVIGLVITLSAYAITLFITTRLLSGGTGSTQPSATASCTWNGGSASGAIAATQSSCLAHCATVAQAQNTTVSAINCQWTP